METIEENSATSQSLEGLQSVTEKAGDDIITSHLISTLFQEEISLDEKIQEIQSQFRQADSKEKLKTILQKVVAEEENIKSHFPKVESIYQRFLAFYEQIPKTFSSGHDYTYFCKCLLNMGITQKKEEIIEEKIKEIEASFHQVDSKEKLRSLFQQILSGEEKVKTHFPKVESVYQQFLTLYEKIPSTFSSNHDYLYFCKCISNAALAEQRETMVREWVEKIQSGFAHVSSKEDLKKVIFSIRNVSSIKDVSQLFPDNQTFYRYFRLTYDMLPMVLDSSIERSYDGFYQYVITFALKKVEQKLQKEKHLARYYQEAITVLVQNREILLHEQEFRALAANDYFDRSTLRDIWQEEGNLEVQLEDLYAQRRNAQQERRKLQRKSVLMQFFFKRKIQFLNQQVSRMGRAIERRQNRRDYILTQRREIENELAYHKEELCRLCGFRISFQEYQRVLSHHASKGITVDMLNQKIVQLQRQYQQLTIESLEKEVSFLRTKIPSSQLPQKQSVPRK